VEKERREERETKREEERDYIRKDLILMTPPTERAKKREKKSKSGLQSIGFVCPKTIKKDLINTQKPRKTVKREQKGVKKRRRLSIRVGFRGYSAHAAPMCSPSTFI